MSERALIRLRVNRTAQGDARVMPSHRSHCCRSSATRRAGSCLRSSISASMAWRSPGSADRAALHGVHDAVFAPCPAAPDSGRGDPERAVVLAVVCGRGSTCSRPRRQRRIGPAVTSHLCANQLVTPVREQASRSRFVHRQHRTIGRWPSAAAQCKAVQPSPSALLRSFPGLRLRRPASSNFGRRVAGLPGLSRLTGSQAAAWSRCSLWLGSDPCFRGTGHREVVEPPPGRGRQPLEAAMALKESAICHSSRPAGLQGAALGGAM